jgi:hypothetical protein
MNIVNKEDDPNMFSPLASLDRQLIHRKHTPEQAMQAIYQAQQRTNRHSSFGKTCLPRTHPWLHFFNCASHQRSRGD